jgi:hypothetical protein
MSRQREFVCATAHTGHRLRRLPGGTQGFEEAAEIVDGFLDMPLKNQDEN